MESSPRYRENPSTNPSPNQNAALLPSPTSRSSSISSSSDSNCSNRPPTTPPITRSESGNPYPTTFVQADTSSFKQVVQMLTGSTDTAKKHHHHHHHHHHHNHQSDQTQKSSSHNIPPMKSIPKQNNSGGGFRLYERRNSLKNLKIRPLPLNSVYKSHHPTGFSPRKPEILSPSMLDFPSLVLSPVTPLIPDPFDRSVTNHGAGDSSLDRAAEEKAIKEKGFYLHPSPATTPRDSEPRLLPLFPVTSPRVSGSSTASTS